MRPKIYTDYTRPRPTTFRMSLEDKDLVRKYYQNLQSFLNDALNRLYEIEKKIEKNKGD